jgi:PAS domain S-box-containing protein
MSDMYTSLEAIIEVFRKAITCRTEESLAKTCLSVSERLTGSKFGFIGEVHNNRLDTIAISDPGWGACRIEETNAVRLINDMEIRGLWSLGIRNGKSYVINEPSSHQDSVGVPEGHPELERLLIVPLKNMKDEIIGIIALGNKSSDYTLKDQESLEKLSVAIVQALLSKRVELENKNVKNRLQKLFNSIQAGILIIEGVSGIIIDANPAASRMVGIGTDLIIGKTCKEYLCAGFCDGCPLVEGEDINGDVENKEVLIQRRDGSVVHALLTITSILIDNRRVFINTLIDVTKQKEAESDRDRYLCRAKELLEKNVNKLKNGSA